MRIHWLTVGFLTSAAVCAAQTPGAFFSVPPADAPELAHRGKYAVGVRTLELTNPGQVDILNLDKDTQKAPLYDRPLTVEVWYPSEIPSGQIEETRYEMALPAPPGQAPALAKTFLIAGKALRGAPPVRKEPFPLVIVSHGYPGSRFFLSYLSENLASRGYVVAAIDHTDSVLGAVKPFASTLLNRAGDQTFTIDAIAELSARPGHFLNGLVDATRAAIVGYSMGGYGALANAGAPYSKTSMANRIVPGGYFGALTAGSGHEPGAAAKRVKAIVAIAPWGGQPPFSVWEPEALAGIGMPMLVIAGDQDDIADFANGIKPIFDRAIHSDRCLLLYENARHNVGGNPPPPEVLDDFTSREYFDEPVWRKDRITAINQHFVTAFLDLTLKGDETRRAYLHPTPVKSNDGQWPLPPGTSVGGKVSDGKDYWRGFQRRWAVGLEMHCRPPEP
jgi:predicted dienelactone hydrolase